MLAALKSGTWFLEKICVAQLDVLIDMQREEEVMHKVYAKMICDRDSMYGLLPSIEDMGVYR